MSDGEGGSECREGFLLLRAQVESADSPSER